jgi:hypothetical protein
MRVGDNFLSVRSGILLAVRGQFKSPEADRVVNDDLINAELREIAQKG